MSDDYEVKVRSLVPAKALAIASYGESVAAYRYHTLHDKTDDTALQAVFADMAIEEQGHHRDVQELLRKYYPPGDFVLSPEDKALVIVGTRLLEVTDRASFEQALGMIYESELLTGRFYQALADTTDNEQLRPVLRAMGQECFDHGARLKALPQSPLRSAQ